MNKITPLILTVLSLLIACARSAPGAEPAPLKDKTLVAWVAPANLTQRGGSVLTIDDQQGHFDGIIFGEIAPAKWMAGSDFYRRTDKVQGDWPAETADVKAFVQIAIVYRGTEVTTYRAGKAYSRHPIKSPQQFEEDSAVVIGLRHLEAGDRACFAGRIADARIYAQALSAEQIAALKPNQSSGPKPWAWWSFDDKEAKDRMGRFPVTQLVGGAAVIDGKLVLDGKNGSMLGKTGNETQIASETPAMPASPPASWLTYHLAHPGPGNAMPGDPNCAFHWKGRYHLHYIYKNKTGFVFAHVSSLGKTNFDSALAEVPGHLLRRASSRPEPMIAASRQAGPRARTLWSAAASGA